MSLANNATLKQTASSMLFSVDASVLLVIDIQEKFIPVIPDCDRLFAKTQTLIKAAKLLGMPVLVSEQYPQGLGQTIPSLKDCLPDDAVYYAKTTFGCLATPALHDALAALNRPQVIVCGFETHVCVNQTVHQLLEQGYQVHLVEDAIASRMEENRDIALRKMEQSGAVPSSVEMVLFELLRDAKRPEFKTLLSFIK